jgi:hypothetical protein
MTALLGKNGKADDLPSDVRSPKNGFGCGSEDLSTLLHIVACCMKEASLNKVGKSKGRQNGHVT